MNHNMEAAIACIEGLKRLDDWEESDFKTEMIRLRSSLCREKKSTNLLSQIEYLDPLGRKISLFEWAVATEGIDKHVNETRFNEGICVSTVWIGLNHGWFGNIVIFETMIFGIEDDEELKDYQDRYGTLKEAEEGHVKAVNLVQLYLKNNKKDDLKPPFQA